MPLYEYQCEACTRRFELIRKFSDPPLEACPTCGGAVRKLMSSPAFQFKGSGWYITDYAKKTGQSADGDEPKADAAGKEPAAAGAGEKTEKPKPGKSDQGESTGKADTAAKGAKSEGSPSATTPEKSA
jgi:putative FmdB family regulatory protein